MNRFLLILFLPLTFNCFSQTQAEMNKEAYELYHEVDNELNEVYQKILTEYKTDTLFVENLKASQRIWINFRDAEVKMKFPDYQNKNYGTIHPTCRAFYLLELTEYRTKTLKEWLNGIDGIDACNGSVKTKKDSNFAFVATKKFVELKLPDSLVIIPNRKLIADFNGDLKPDIATLVKNKHNSKTGVLIINHSNNKMFVFGAGKEVDNMTDLNWIEIFKTIPKGEIVAPELVDEETGDLLGPDESKNFKLIGNGIYMSVTETHGGGIIFWNGNDYEWFHIE